MTVKFLIYDIDLKPVHNPVILDGVWGLRVR